MPRYDAIHHDPPAPVATVTIRMSYSDASVSDILLLIDTGADITLLPRSAVQGLGAATQGQNQYEVIGFDGTRTTADSVELDMIFLRKSFRGRYLLTDEPHGILGRDVLAALKLTFDGPLQEWLESTRTT
jgi:predicted aspartyl protease